MNDPAQDEALARNRFFIIGMTRLMGAILLALGILVVLGKIAWPQVVGYALLIIGLADTLVLPRLLTKRWRSDPE
jgi:hypothetical protein